MQTERIELARSLATYAHKGQVDKGGMPYINHPLAVMNMVDSEDEKIVAVLHDILEDTFVTFDTLLNLFGDEIAHSVLFLSRLDGEIYDKYIERIGLDDIARKVKLADLKHNMDLSRLPTVTEKDLKRKEKYEKAYRYLKSLPD